MGYRMQTSWKGTAIQNSCRQIFRGGRERSQALLNWVLILFSLLQILNRDMKDCDKILFFD